MVKVVIDDIEYETENLEDNAKAQIASVQFLDVHMQTLRNEIAVFETAKRAYQRTLKSEIEGTSAETKD